jgi:phosphatidylglycerophosphate synthase
MVIGHEVTVELTSKCLKFIQLLSILLILLGLAISFMLSHYPAWSPIGAILATISLISLIVTRIRIWWHHK